MGDCLLPRFTTFRVQTAGQTAPPETPAADHRIPRAEIVPVRVLLPVTMYGFSLFWAWNFLTFYSPTLLPPASVSSREQALARLCMLLGMAFAAFLSSRRPRIYAIEMTVPALLIAFGLTLPTSVIGFLDPGVDIPLILRLSAWFLSGCAFALMLAIWSSMFVISWRHDIGAHVALSVVVGAAHTVFAASLSGVYAVAASVALPAVSLIIFFFVRSHAHVMSFNADGTRTSTILPPGSSVVIALYGILFAVPAYTLLRSTTPPLMLGMAVALAVGALAYSGYGLKVDHYLPFGSVLRVLLPLSVVFFFMLPFMEPTGQLLCCLVLLAVLACLDAANLSTLIARSYEHAFPASQLIAAGRIYLALGKAIGWTACLLFLPDDFSFPHTSAIVLLGLVMLLALAVALIPPYVHVVADSDAKDEMGPGGRFAQRLSRTAAKYGLSDREQEVLRFLAKGRHAQYIGNALHISPHTAKTHISHIYRKMDVSSLEELMDVVEHIKA